MLRALFALLIGGLLGLAGWGAFGYLALTKTNDLPDPGVSLRIESGWSSAQIAQKLEEQGLIPNAFFFRIASKWYGRDNRFKAGSYRIKGSVTPLQIQEILLEGQVLTKQFTIAEGLNQWQIADKLVEAFPAYGKEEFLTAFRNPDLLSLLPEKASTAEGYLFPDTYTVNEAATPNDIARMMVLECLRRLTPETRMRASDKGLDTHALVTLASIVEKETGAPSERGLIAAVFHNRLRKGMRLQTDPTVIYGIWPTYDGNIRKKDLLTPTPYNTYVIDGLPPGPIASPGEDAILKTAEPDNADFLYFVARGDGTGLHDFSRTLEEHNRAVSRYLRRYRQRIAR